ncbi:MAG: glycosyl hydrolase 115 family protein [Williamsia sp.]|nr:glycosyl hydrolase 115 family protein [Williamsia sp.]
MIRKIVLACLGCIVFNQLWAQWVTEQKEANAFNVLAATIVVDPQEDTLVKMAASLLQHDIEMVTGKTLPVLSREEGNKSLILIGTFGHSRLLQQEKAASKIADKVGSRWEAYQIQVVPGGSGLPQSLVIAGSDKRGTAYGVFELSKHIGVSPWYWWADVPVKHKAALYVKGGTSLSEAPSVKYRGIFINDEAPAFSGWTKEKFGGANHRVYEKMFELLLRLKANYLWPAMWGNAFNDDDPLNPILADQWGIVMGTTHHEPMLRAQQEWKRYGKGLWNYDSNAAVLRAFWKKGIENMGRRESIVSIGMRGDGDMPMTQGTAIGLLEKIVADQRKIIEEVTGKPAAQTPQLWALYKEVQDYYDKGMRVPDDVTLLLSDDNWGNLRKLPRLTDKPRSGGYGIYYHFDYVGGPRNYKWINTNNISRVWEQMHLAYEYGVDRIWIVNVGDLKPMEFPISFFLDYAWNTKKWNEDNLRDYYTQWAGDQFGAAHAKEIGDIMRKYAQYSARRKPELLDANTYSLTDYGEANRVVEEYNQLLKQAERVNSLLPDGYKDAYFELVLHPLKALTNLQELYWSVAMNRYEAANKSPAANVWADKAKELYRNDSLIAVQYHSIQNGKWNHMMDQTHIGYTYWQQPPVNKMPEVKYVSKDSALDVAVRADTVGTLHGYRIPKTDKAATEKGPVFYKTDKYVSMEAAHWTRAVSTEIKWKVIPDIGREGSGISTFPVTATVQLSAASPHVEWVFFTRDSGTVQVQLYFSPTLNLHQDEGLKYAVSIDGETPQIFSLNKEDNNNRTWEGWVANNIIVKRSTHTIGTGQRHVLKYWMISPAIVLQKLVVDFGGTGASYLGPPETAVNNQK